MIKFLRSLIAFGIVAAMVPAGAQVAGERGVVRTQPQNANDCGRIVGGDCAAPGAWPWQVALYARPTPDKDFSAICGGSIIAERWVLTAAHCVVLQGQVRAPGNLFVIEGTNHLGDGEGRRIAVRRVIHHESWSPETMENDIALLELGETARSAPVSFATEENAALEVSGKFGTVTGWGVTHPFRPLKDQNGNYIPGYFVDEHTGQPIPAQEAQKFLTKNLRQVELPLKSWQECRAHYEKLKIPPLESKIKAMDQRVICAGFPQGGKDSCQGDSGGPLVARDAQNRWVQIGVVSWGPSCAIPDTFGIYSRTTAFEPWLRAQTSIDQGRPSPATQNVIPTSIGAENSANLSVAFVQGRSVRVGQSVQASVSTQKPGYLILLDADAEGKVTQIYPSRLSLRSPTGSELRPIKAGVPLLVPNPQNPYEGFEYKIDGPTGPGRLVAVLTNKRIDELSVPDAPKVFEKRGDAISLLGLIVSAVNRDIEASGTDKTASIAYFDYTISK